MADPRTEEIRRACIDAYDKGAQNAFESIAEGFRVIGAPDLASWVEDFAAAASKAGEQRA